VTGGGVVVTETEALPVLPSLEAVI